MSVDIFKDRRLPAEAVEKPSVSEGLSPENYAESISDLNRIYKAIIPLSGSVFAVAGLVGGVWLASNVHNLEIFTGFAPIAGAVVLGTAGTILGDLVSTSLARAHLGIETRLRNFRS